MDGALSIVMPTLQNEAGSPGADWIQQASHCILKLPSRKPELIPSETRLLDFAFAHTSFYFRNSLATWMETLRTCLSPSTHHPLYLHPQLGSSLLLTSGSPVFPAIAHCFSLFSAGWTLFLNVAGSSASLPALQAFGWFG